MERQSSTSDNGSYRNCSKIFDSHGDGFSTTPRNNRSHSEMVPECCLPLALERLLARRPEDILVNPVECGEIGPDYSARQVPQRVLCSRGGLVSWRSRA